jgi:hypothetical protein
MHPAAKTSVIARMVWLAHRFLYPVKLYSPAKNVLV